MELMNRIGRELSLYFSKLSAFARKAVDAPAEMWRQTAGEPGSRLLLSVFAFAAAAALSYLIWAFIKAPLREKLRSIVSFGIAALMVLVIMYFAL